MRCFRKHHPLQFLLLVSVALASLVIIAGCGDGHPKTYPVNGKVVFADGSPLTTGGVVLCQSVVVEGAPVNARGAINTDGTFTLTTFVDGDGAISGKHRVLVRAKRDTADFTERGMLPRPIIDPKLESFETSGLEFSVEDKDNEWKLIVKRPQAQWATKN